MQLVRQADPDRYLSVLYAPEAKRGALFALYAFNAEIARIRDVVSAPMPGEIRLQWWRDAISSGTIEGAGGHPVASALLAAIAEHGLPGAALQNCLDARVFDLYDDAMPGRTELEGYCGETASALIQLAAMILDPHAAPDFAALAGHAGCAQAIALLIRHMPLHRARGQCYVPPEILAAAGLTRDAFIAGEPASAMRAAVSAMAALAGEHHAAFLRGAARIPVSLRPAFLPLAPTAARLDRIEPDTAWTAPATDISALRRQWLFLRRAAKGWG
ncbi:MAG: phytoene/squalene synthase family protein [Mesorhizobium sp.]|nr:phytoene/squalene synthase family protein [Mesorhizobium sp.]